MIDKDIDSGMSAFSFKLWLEADLDIVRKKRIDNAKYLIEGLQEFGICPLNQLCDSVPLFVPIIINRRDDLRKLMFKNNIFCPIHWPIDNYSHTSFSERMANNELSLIVDQRYDIVDMHRELSIIKKFLCQ